MIKMVAMMFSAREKHQKPSVRLAVPKIASDEVVKSTRNRTPMTTVGRVMVSNCPLKREDAE